MASKPNQSWCVVGGAGFIGSHLVERLLELGDEVLVIDDLSSGRRENLPARVKLIEAPVETLSPELLSGMRFAGIAHLAAVPSVQASWDDVLGTHHANLSSTARVVALARALDIPRVVLASSAAVYGDCTRLPHTESCSTVPISPYGLHKLSSEQYLNLYSAKFGFGAVNLRLFNVFGPRQRDDSEYSGVISKFSAFAKSGRDITVFGDGEQSRDFVYVGDVANAFASALSSGDIRPGEARTINVGTGSSVTVNDLLSVLTKLNPSMPTIEYAAARVGDIVHSSASISALRGLLGRDYEFVGFEAGIRRLLEAGGGPQG